MAFANAHRIIDKIIKFQARMSINKYFLDTILVFNSNTEVV